MCGDPAVFGFGAASESGGVFDPNASPATGFCVGPDTTTFDSDGGGVVVGCAGYAATSRTNSILTTLTLTPLAPGCSAIHLFTFGGADAGDANNGTFTVNGADDSVQANRYADGSSDTTGQPCAPLAPTPGPQPGSAPPSEAPSTTLIRPSGPLAMFRLLNSTWRTSNAHSNRSRRRRCSCWCLGIWGRARVVCNANHHSHRCRAASSMVEDAPSAFGPASGAEECAVQRLRGEHVPTAAECGDARFGEDRCEDGRAGFGCG